MPEIKFYCLKHKIHGVIVYRLNTNDPQKHFFLIQKSLIGIEFGVDSPEHYHSQRKIKKS